MSEDQRGEFSDIHRPGGRLAASHRDMRIDCPGIRVALCLGGWDFQPLDIGIGGGQQTHPDNPVGLVLDRQPDQVAGSRSRENADGQGCQEHQGQDEHEFLVHMSLL